MADTTVSDDLIDEDEGEPIGGDGAIVPASGIAGRSLALVIAIMSFLSCLTIGSVMLVWGSVETWREAVVSEVTIQIVPTEGADTLATLVQAQDLANNITGIADARIVDLEETARLLEPWLGAQPNLDELPLPRLIAVRLDEAVPADLDALRLGLSVLPGASLEDHTLWRDQLGAMAQLLVVIGITLLALMLAATTLTVVFATRGAMAGNRDTVRVLDLVGAGRDFIASEFQRHFLRLGLKGGLYGGVAAALVFLLAHWLTRAGGADSQVQLLFGTFAIGWRGYLGLVAVVGLVSAITAVTSRWTALRYLDETDSGA
ncbi:MAG: ABC transporter permease [Pseudomonadota bacterium]